MNAQERAERNQRVLQLFLAGATYPQIAAAVGLRTSAVDAVIRRELAGSQLRRTVLDEDARAVHQERTEALFRAHWGAALRGDHRSAEICRRILDRQARLLPEAAATTEGDAVDEIAARRAARRAGPAAGSARTHRAQ